MSQAAVEDTEVLEQVVSVYRERPSQCQRIKLLLKVMFDWRFQTCIYVCKRAMKVDRHLNVISRAYLSFGHKRDLKSPHLVNITIFGRSGDSKCDIVIMFLSSCLCEGV